MIDERNIFDQPVQNHIKTFFWTFFKINIQFLITLDSNAAK